MSIAPIFVIKAIIVSVKKRAFSRRQSQAQKLWTTLAAVSVFCSWLSVCGVWALAIGVIVFILFRWINLKVLDIKEGVLFFGASLYASVLFLLSVVYGFLYKIVFRHVKTVEFFPKFPFNHQTLTNSATDGETLSRDRFWGKRIPRNVPSPNSLTITRMVGAVLLLFLHSITPILFFLLVGILFLTDYFDGIIARTQGRETLFGKWADPIADRILLASAAFYLYVANSHFWDAHLVSLLVPELLLIFFFGSAILFTKRLPTPRPVIWGRLKFLLYSFGVLSLFFHNFSLANIFLVTGIVFSYIALGSYVTRMYQERSGESIFNGVLRWCTEHSERIRGEVEGLTMET